jgi:hypothetical protein
MYYSPDRICIQPHTWNTVVERMKNIRTSTQMVSIEASTDRAPNTVETCVEEMTQMSFCYRKFRAVHLVPKFLRRNPKEYEIFCFLNSISAFNSGDTENEIPVIWTVYIYSSFSIMIDSGLNLYVNM